MSLPRRSAGASGACEQRGRPFEQSTRTPSTCDLLPGATRMAAKLIFDPDDGTILGAQIVGRNGVDKRIDVIATAMSAGMTADRLADLELAYAPPFSSAKDPVNLLGYMAENVLSGDCDVVDPHEIDSLVEQGWMLLDVRTREEHAAGAITGSVQRADRLAPGSPRHARERARGRLLRGGSTRAHSDSPIA